MGRLKEFLSDETGDGLLVMFPLASVVCIMMLALLLNFMMWNSEKNGLQIMADSASRAGAVAVNKAYAVRERTGYGLSDYHVYIELNKAEAEELSQRVINAYSAQLYLSEVIDVEKNPVGNFTFPVWNSNTFKYDERPLSTQKQYKNGNFSVYVRGKIISLWPGLLGIKEELNVELYSQSAARGKVTGIY